MVRITGSFSDEKSVTAPTVDSFRSVVRRRMGNRAKRMSGTESSPPTKTEPSPNNTPTNERLVSRGNSDDVFGMVSAEGSACSNMQSLTSRDQPAMIPEAYFLPGRVRIYATSLVTSSDLIFAPKAGIFPRPLEITSESAASLSFWTSSERRSLACIALPVGLPPLPSAEWHRTQLVL